MRPVSITTALAFGLAAAIGGCRSDLTTPPRQPLERRAKHLGKLAADPQPSDSAALTISRIIQQRHLPYGTIADPGFASSDSTSPGYYTLASYNRAGDAAIWTGHYLAAESFRYAATGSSGALKNVRHALDGIANLVAVTSPADPGLLARFFMPVTSPYASGIIAAEQHNGIYQSTLDGEPVYWIGSTSRDQYSGVMFGLAVAYDFVSDNGVRSRVSGLVTQLLAYLLNHGWNVVMPDGTISTTFLQRPDQQLAFLQIGRHVNPAQFAATYAAYRATEGATVALPIETECQDTYGGYYKFNLDYINLFDLVRLEAPTSPFLLSYQQAYRTLRGCTGGDENAHFNMIDRALQGPIVTRDTATVDYLGRWLERSRRDYYVDLSAKYPACGTNRACSPVPVNDRPNTDFLWQRSPLLLQGGGAGTIETAGIDYLLPYWMARYYGVL